LEAQPLDGICQLDVDAEVVGVELELVTLEQRTLFVDVHQQRRDVAVDVELPMAILRRFGLEVDAALAVVQFAFCVGHGFLTTSFSEPSLAVSHSGRSRRLGQARPRQEREYRLPGARAGAGLRSSRSLPTSPPAPPCA